MRSISQIYPDIPRGSEAAKALADAYQTVFDGEAGRIVLTDLCDHCKMFENVTISPGIDNAQLLVDFNARRSVYGRILQFLRLSGDELTALERAAAVERKVNLEQGPF